MSASPTVPVTDETAPDTSPAEDVVAATDGAVAAEEEASADAPLVVAEEEAPPVAEDKAAPKAEEKAAPETEEKAAPKAEEKAAPEAKEKAADDGGEEKVAPETEETPKAEQEQEAADDGGEKKKWPGWPGESVFRLVMPVGKVGGIIGRKGELIKKLCEETRARVRILDGPMGDPDRIVLVSCREETEAKISPAMDAVVRIFKRVNSLKESDDVSAPASASNTVCSVRLLVPSSQAVSLIGKQGSVVKSIQDNSGATIRVHSGDEVSIYATSDERIVEVQGESLRVLKGLKAVLGHLRKFLVDQSVLPLFEKSFSTTVVQGRTMDVWGGKAQSFSHSAKQTAISSDYARPLKRDPYLDREAYLDRPFQHGLSLYGQDPTLSALHSHRGGSATGALVTQVAQTMQIPLVYAEDIIGVGGEKIAYIRRTSGAVLSVQESRGLPNDLTVEIKGSFSQVQAAQQLIQEFVSEHREPVASAYGIHDSGMTSNYSRYESSTYPSSLTSQTYGRYGPPGVGEYSNSCRY